MSSGGGEDLGSQLDFFKSFPLLWGGERGPFYYLYMYNFINYTQGRLEAGTVLCLFFAPDALYPSFRIIIMVHTIIKIFVCPEPFYTSHYIVSY